MEQIYGITSRSSLPSLTGTGPGRQGGGPGVVRRRMAAQGGAAAPPPPPPTWSAIWPIPGRAGGFVSLPQPPEEGLPGSDGRDVGHVTPAAWGSTPCTPVRGLESYAWEKGLELPIRELDVPALKSARPTVGQCRLRTAWPPTARWLSWICPMELVKELDSGTGSPS